MTALGYECRGTAEVMSPRVIQPTAAERARSSVAMASGLRVWPLLEASDVTS